VEQERISFHRNKGKNKFYNYLKNVLQIKNITLHLHTKQFYKKLKLFHVKQKTNYQKESFTSTQATVIVIISLLIAFLGHNIINLF
jgi:hypothetical protein